MYHTWMLWARFHILFLQGLPFTGIRLGYTRAIIMALPTTPTRNKGLIAGLIKGNQWLTSSDHKTPPKQIDIPLPNNQPQPIEHIRRGRLECFTWNSGALPMVNKPLIIPYFWGWG